MWTWGGVCVAGVGAGWEQGVVKTKSHAPRCYDDGLYTQLKSSTYKPPMVFKAEGQVVVDIALWLSFSWDVV